jgi:hypothetical protein
MLYCRKEKRKLGEKEKGIKKFFSQKEKELFAIEKPL